MNNEGIDVILHYPGLFHAERKVLPEKSIFDILEKIGRDNETPKAVANWFLEKKDNLSQRFQIFADGVPILSDLATVNPKHTLLVFATNKIKIRAGDRFENYRSDSPGHCFLCNQHPMLYRYLCKSCFLEQYEGVMFRYLKEKDLPKRPVVFAHQSGERDITVAMSVFFKFAEREGIEPDVKLFFNNNGNEGAVGYRSNCQKAVEQFCDQHGLAVSVARIPGDSPLSLDRVAAFYRRTDSRENICEVCRMTNDILNASKSISGRGKDTYVLNGFNLSDFSRMVFAGDNREGRTLREHFRDEFSVISPLKMLTDEDVNVYAALTNINYYVSDCPQQENAGVYFTNRIVQLMAMVSGHWIYGLMNQLQQKGEEEISSRWDVFNPIYDYYDRTLSVDNLSYSKTDIVLEDEPGGWAHAICEKCKELIWYRELASVLYNEHDCAAEETKQADEETKKFMEEYHQAFELAVDNHPDPGRRLGLDIGRYRLSPWIGVTFGHNAIFLMNQATRDRYSIAGPQKWQQQLLQKLNGFWVSTDKLQKEFVPLVEGKEAELAHFLDLLVQTEIVQTASSPTSRTSDGPPADKVVFLDKLGLYGAQIEDERFRVIDVKENDDFSNLLEPLNKTERIVLGSNLSQDHLAVARVALRQKKSVFHCTVTGHLFVMGPISSSEGRGCFGCLSSLANKRNMISMAFDLDPRQKWGSQAGWLLRGMLESLLESEKGFGQANWVRCFDAYNFLSQRLRLKRDKDCPVCSHPISS